MMTYSLIQNSLNVSPDMQYKYFIVLPVLDYSFIQKYWLILKFVGFFRRLSFQLFQKSISYQ